MTSVGRRIGAGRAGLWAGIGALLVLPAIAMRITPEVRWDAADFAAAALLLIGGGLVFEFGARLVHGPGRRAWLGIVIVAVVGTIWADAAVGIF